MIIPEKPSLTDQWNTVLPTTPTINLNNPSPNFLSALNLVQTAMIKAQIVIDNYKTEHNISKHLSAYIDPFEQNVCMNDEIISFKNIIIPEIPKEKLNDPQTP